MESNTKRIAKNTLLLYLRQILVLAVSLYTVRVRLEVLGVENFGIYNIVAGFVFLFAFLNGAMTSTTQRFLNFAMGQNDEEQVRKVFSISIIIHIFIALFIIVLAETLGLWFFYNILNIPPERHFAAFIVYQLTIILAVATVIKVPYDAIIIANEKMAFYSFISILEAFFKLAIVYLLLVLIIDKLILYSFLCLLTGLITFFISKIYCNKSFKTSKFKYYNDKQFYKNILSFSGWNVLSQVSIISQSQGTNILLNVFHGVFVNAAIGLANQVNSAVYTFLTNFQKAFRPQVIKSYAANDTVYFMKLLFQTSKISYFLLFLITLPLIINAEFVLQIWLKNIPEYTVDFTRIVLFVSLDGALSGPLLTAFDATGDIKRYQITKSILNLSTLPIMFLLLFFKFNILWIILIKIPINLIFFILCIIYSRKMISLSVSKYFFNVILPIVIITILSSTATIFSSFLFIEWKGLLFTCFISTLSILLFSFFIGLNNAERITVVNIVRKYIKNEK